MRLAVVGMPAVENCLSGLNACIFAYGEARECQTHCCAKTTKTHASQGFKPLHRPDWLRKDAYYDWTILEL